MIVITIPAYNEEKSLGNVIKEIRKIMDKTKEDYKILVVDDGSKDKTVEIAKKNNAIVKSNKINLGLALTFQREMKECLDLNADIIVHTDADGQYPAEYIPSLINRVKDGYDLVLGSRFEKGKYEGSFIKKLGNKAFAKVFTNLLKTKVTDTTTGFRAFNKEVAKLQIINTFTYTQEQLIRAAKSNMSIAEVPITTRKTRESRLFKNPLDYAIKAWINILRIERDFNPIKFFGSIGAFFLLIGVMIGLYFVMLQLTTGIHGHTALMFLMLILIFTGIQIILFGFLADMRN
ncbi:glycosyltransferase family 2 protein [Candidatus Woesearchaeota archaeon]|nr:glycosyltransferase family 2 protein [Candidatus Woesearchaeota archaeon]